MSNEEAFQKGKDKDDNSTLNEFTKDDDSTAQGEAELDADVPKPEVPTEETQVETTEEVSSDSAAEAESTETETLEEKTSDEAVKQTE
jgi:hypothetical protein